MSHRQVATELATHKIDFILRIAIKSQTLADFIAEWTEIQSPVTKEDLEHWSMHFDGSLMIKGGGARVLFITPK